MGNETIVSLADTHFVVNSHEANVVVDNAEASGHAVQRVMNRESSELGGARGHTAVHLYLGEAQEIELGLVLQIFVQRILVPYWNAVSY